jgi:hypothetical protein
MDFQTQQSELAAQLGLDVSDTDTLTLLKRWLNTSQQMICQAAEWPFLRNSTPLIVQTVADITTGTIATTASGATITFSSAPASSVTGYYVQTSSSKDWYRITAHTGGATTATISPSAIYAVTAGTYIVRKFYYALDSTVDRVLQIRQSITPFQLEEKDKEGFDQMNANPQDIGTPLVFVMAGKNSSDIWQFILWPTPNAVVNLYVEYLKAPVDLSANSDVSIIPAKWHTSVMLDGAKWQGYMFNDDTRMDAARQTFYQGLEQMKQELMPSRSESRTLRPIDLQQPLFPFPLPQEYGSAGRSWH